MDDVLAFIEGVPRPLPWVYGEWDSDVVDEALKEAERSEAAWLRAAKYHGR